MPGTIFDPVFELVGFPSNFVGMIVLLVPTGLPWRAHVAQIVQGLEVSPIVGILIEALQSYFGRIRDKDFYQFLPHIQIGNNLVTVTYCVITLARKAPNPRALPGRLRRQLLHPNDTPLEYPHPRRPVP